jgi:hypothetical protein
MRTTARGRADGVVGDMVRVERRLEREECPPAADVEASHPPLRAKCLKAHKECAPARRGR